MTITAHHGTHHTDLPRHAGLCLAFGGGDDGYSAASAYARLHGGECVFEVALDDADLMVEVIDNDVRECVRSGEWPCDSAREVREFVARGVDAVIFRDADHRGNEHRTIRLLSDRALAAVAVVEAYDPA